MKSKRKRGFRGYYVLAINILFIAILIHQFDQYSSLSEEKIRNQNLTNISNLNRSSAELSRKFFENQQRDLQNIVQYAVREELSLSELLDFIYNFNADENSTYELIGQEKSGYLAQKNENGEYTSLNYTSRDYKALHPIFMDISAQNVGKVKLAPEFTDDYSAVKCFALFTTIPIYNEDGTKEFYVLMSLSKSQAFIDMVQVNGSYDDMSSALFDHSGNYIIGNSKFKSDNFFQYIRSFNNLSMDEKNSLQQTVLSSSEGILYYKNSYQEDCTYVYCSLNGGVWYIVSCLPLSSFQDLNEDFRFTLSVVISFAIIFLIDFIWLSGLNRKLKLSMMKERRANDAKTDFLSRMSHDIRTPLNAIIGFSSLARSEDDLSETVADQLDKIQSSGKYLLGLVNDILDMSKIEKDKVELHESFVDILAILNDISFTFTAQAKQKKITLETDFTNIEAQWLYMDDLRTRQIYNNLLNNAIKFSNEGTTITWKVLNKIISVDQVEMISIISDQGCGMSDEFMNHIFQPFEQEQNSHSEKEGGTGLGLSIVKSLVEIMKGTIQAESELGKGSTFTIRLEPRFDRIPELTHEKNGEKGRIEKLRGKIILLCEDQPLNQEIMIKILDKKGVLVETADNGQIGISMFNKSSIGYYAAILMDMRMPVMNGLEATKAIRALSRDDAATIPIIAITANAFDDDIQNCLDVGMNDHIAKPISPSILFDKLCKQLS